MKTCRSALAATSAGLLAIMVMISGCGGSSGGDSAEAEHRQDDDAIQQFDDAIQVSPVLDESAAVSERVEPVGGEITATGADGTVYRLQIPAESLVYAATITMTPLSSVDGLPFGDGPSYGVDLEPSGLRFLEPATLFITPPAPIPVEEQIPFGYVGTELTLGELSAETAELELVVSHFSGHGVAKGFYGHTEDVLQRIGGTEEARIGAEMSAVIAQARAHKLSTGESDNASWDRMRELWELYEERVAKPRLAAAHGNCDDASTILTWYLGYQRQRYLLGDEDPLANDTIRELFDTAYSTCIEEEWQMCAQEHIVHRLLYVWLGALRTNEIIGMPSDTVVELARQRTEDCMSFDLEFTTIGEMTVNDGSGPVWSQDTATVTFPVRFQTSGYPKFAETTATITADQGQIDFSAWENAANCSATANAWSGEARFIAMGWDTTNDDLTSDIGQVENIRAWVELPRGTFRPLATGACTHRGASFDWQMGAAAEWAYEMTHEEDWPIQNWTVLGGEIFATTEWEAVSSDFDFELNESGTAVLRHTPGA